jgi:vacuolar-type H+-ATPase subunit I/STV1
MTRPVLVVIGAALLSVGGIGIIVGLVWLTASKMHGTLPYIFDARAETLLYMLPALLLVVAIIGAAFVAAALCTPQKDQRIQHNLHPHTRFHA